MKKLQFLVLPVLSITVFYLLGLSFISGLDKQIANECAVNPTYDYCVMYAESQNVDQGNKQVLIASVK